MTMTTNIPSGKKIPKNKIEGVRKLAHKNMRLIMKKLDFKGEDQGARLVGCCPVPHSAGKTPNDNRKAFSWDFHRQMWQCFSHHCHTINGADVFALIQCVKECNFKQALQWVLDVVEKDIDDVKELNSEEALKLEQVIRKRAQLVKHQRRKNESRL